MQYTSCCELCCIASQFNAGYQSVDFTVMCIYARRKSADGLDVLYWQVLGASKEGRTRSPARCVRLFILSSQYHGVSVPHLWLLQEGHTLSWTHLCNLRMLLCLLA